MYKVREEEMVICPYNNHHVVSKLRIQKHIMKCQKSNPGTKLAACFYNYSHKLKPEALLEHYKTCSHKTRLNSTQFDESPSPSPSSSVKNDFPQSSFPDINIKTQFFCSSSFTSDITQKDDMDGQELKIPDSESESENQLKVTQRASFNSKFSLAHKDKDDSGKEESDSDDNLKPLPLPKTASKAFVYPKQEECKSPVRTVPESFHIKRFGRGYKYLLPCLSNMKSDLPQGERISKLFLDNSHSDCSESVVSTFFDDSSSLKSEEVIFDESSDENDNNSTY